MFYEAASALILHSHNSEVGLTQLLSNIFKGTNVWYWLFLLWQGFKVQGQRILPGEVQYNKQEETSWFDQSEMEEEPQRIIRVLMGNL